MLLQSPLKQEDQEVSALKVKSRNNKKNPSARACATDIAMDKNKIAAKLRGREFEIEGIDAEGIIHCKQKVIRLRDRSKVEILITSCNVPGNNVTCLAHVKQKTHTTVFKPIFENDSKLVPVKNSGILIHTQLSMIITLLERTTFTVTGTQRK